MTTCCKALLHSIVNGRQDVRDVQEFLSLDDIVRTTKMYESGGMESGFVGFAMDCMGNMFLFKKTECVPGAEDAPVWFFDHDFVSIDEEAPSFTAWLARYVDIEAVEG